MISMGSPQNIAAFRASHEDDEFVLLDEKNLEIGKLCLPFQIDKARKDWQNYQVFALRNELQAENSIFEVHSKGIGTSGKRIGWIMPVISIDSKEHDYFQNPHYQAYAYVAVMSFLHRAIQGQIDATLTPLEAEELKFENFFQPNTALLIISNNTLDNPSSFDLNDYIISLAQQGYTRCDLLRNSSTCFTIPGGDGTKLSISKISPWLKNNKFITNLLSQQLLLEDDPTLSFFFSYQIIELMLSKIFDFKRIETLKQYGLSHTNSDGKDILEEYSNWGKEKTQINALFSAEFYDNFSPNHELLSSCNYLLGILKKKHQTSVGHGIYAVRNIVFHNYRIINQLDHLQKITEELISELVRLSSAFKIPPSISDNEYFI